MTLKLKEISELHAALLSLDGYDRIARGAEGQPDQIVHEPYQLGGKVRWNVAKNSGILKQLMDAYNVARNDLVKELSKDGKSIPATDTDALAKFTEEHQKIFEIDHEVSGLLKFNEADLNLDKNPIPPSVLVALMPLIVATPPAP